MGPLEAPLCLITAKIGGYIFSKFSFSFLYALVGDLGRGTFCPLFSQFVSSVNNISLFF